MFSSNSQGKGEFRICFAVWLFTDFWLSFAKDPNSFCLQDGAGLIGRYRHETVVVDDDILIIGGGNTQWVADLDKVFRLYVYSYQLFMKFFPAFDILLINFLSCKVDKAVLPDTCV